MTSFWLVLPLLLSLAQPQRPRDDGTYQLLICRNGCGATGTDTSRAYIAGWRAVCVRGAVPSRGVSLLRPAFWHRVARLGSGALTASLERLRYEALAAEVDRATQPMGALGARLFGRYPEPVEASVERIDGSRIGFQLKEVVLDGDMLVGRDATRQPVAIPLQDVKRLWRRRMTTRRTVAVCGVTMVATSAFLAFMTPASPARLALVGGPLGLVFGAAVAVLLRRVHWLTEWALLYERDQ
jgi:hypothetical protein